MNFVAWEPELPLEEIRAPFPIDCNHSIWQAFRTNTGPQNTSSTRRGFDYSVYSIKDDFKNHG